MLKIPAKMADAVSQSASTATVEHLFASALTVSMATRAKVNTLNGDIFRDKVDMKKCFSLI